MRLDRPSTERGRFLRFLVAGSLAAAVNVASRAVVQLSLPFPVAVAIAYIFGMTTAFVLNRRFVFDGGKARLEVQYSRFAFINAIAFIQVWLTSMGLALYLFPSLGMTWHPDTLAHVMGVLSPIVTSYLGHKHFSFRRG